MLGLTVLVSCAPKSSNITDTNIYDSDIINGSDVKATDAIATSVVAVYNTKTKYLCTGTLIDTNVVLTAAHCAPEKPSQLKIIFSTDIDDTMNSRELDIIQQLMLTVTDFQSHPKWNPNNETVEVNTSDIALIKFKGEIPKGYAPASFLDSYSGLKIGDTVSVAGFGVDYVDISKKIDPKKYHNIDEAIAMGTIICEDDKNGNHVTCSKVEMSGDGILRKTEAPIAFIFETEISLREGKTGTCSGDSGGPAFIKKADAYYLLGVTSRGSSLCNDIGVYTNAIYYKKWITDTSKTLK